MKGYLRGLVCSVCVIFFISGCGTTRTASEGYNALQEKEWLTKAYRYDKNGWIYLHIEGEPFERGFQRGYLTANEIDECLKVIAYVEEFDTAKELGFFTKAATKLFKGKIPKEYVEEMKGMVRGMQKAGKEITYEQMLLMNGSTDIIWYWWPEEKESMGTGCSAFIAAGDVTADGGIVMAHNTWSSYVYAQHCNIIVDIVPDNGHRILMQSWGPFIYSGTDFFITSAGLVGTETTIGGFSGFDKKGIPVFVRARKAMQYANNIDEWAEIMIKNNSGAYANSWLLGDIKTNEIARLELGLKHHSLEKSKDGYFAGSNITDNIKILREETTANYGDVRRSSVARRERWKQLMKKHHGRVSTEIAKQMLADHYDVYLGKEKPSSRTICGHAELDDGSIPTSGSAYRPSGAYDGKVVDSKMARDWKIMAKWGSSCDIGFDSQKYLERHTQYDWLEGYLKDLPARPWTVFPCTAASGEGF